MAEIDVAEVLANELIAHQFGPKPEPPGKFMQMFQAAATPKRWMDQYGVYLCTCGAKWLPLYEQISIIHEDISDGIDVFQGCYHPGVGASAGSHDKGACYDLGQLNDQQVQRARERGGCHQHRTQAQGFTPHMHGWPNGCTHGSPLQQYQQRAWNNGRNGLVSNAPITGPGPIGTDTPHWTEGVKMMEAEVSAFEDAVAAKVAAKVDGRFDALMAAINAVPNKTINGVGINVSADPKKKVEWNLGHIQSWVVRVLGPMNDTVKDIDKNTTPVPPAPNK